MDEKATLILDRYKKCIHSYCFDELDILGFLIFIRQYLEKSHFPSVLEFCDLIAHRERDRGKVMRSINASLSNRFATYKGTKKVIGSEGIDEIAWREEWERIFQLLGMRFNEQAFREITLCIISLANKTIYTSKAGRGKLEAFIDHDNNIDLCYCNDSPDSLYVTFLKSGVWPLINDRPQGVLDYPIILAREGNKLRLNYRDKSLM